MSVLRALGEKAREVLAQDAVQHRALRCYAGSMQVELWTNLPDVGPSAIRRLRRDEYDRLVELGVFDREPVELIQGVIVRMAPQGAPHAGAVQRSNEYLVPKLIGRAHVRVQLPLIAGDDSEPEPDLAVVPLGNYDLVHPAAARLVIEVARTSLAYDRDAKGPLYAKMGVPDFWVVVVVNRVIEVHRSPRGERYESVETYRSGASIATTAFPDVAVDVSTILP